MEHFKHHTFTYLWQSFMGNAHHVVCYDLGAFDTVDHLAATETPYPALKNNSDMHHSAQPMIPNSISAADLAYQRGTIPSVESVCSPEDPSAQLCLSLVSLSQFQCV